MYIYIYIYVYMRRSCSTVEGVQFESRRYILSTENSAQYGSVTTSVLGQGVQYRTTKTAQGGCCWLHLSGRILFYRQTHHGLDFIPLQSYPGRGGGGALRWLTDREGVQSVEDHPKFLGSKLAQMAVFSSKRSNFDSQASIGNLDEEFPDTVHFSNILVKIHT